MYQDYECFPSAWYSESGIDEDTFDRIMEYADMDDDDRDAFDEFSEAFGNDCVASFKERYMGSGILRRISLSTSWMSATISMT